MRLLLPNPYVLGFGISLFCYVLLYGLKRLLTTRLRTGTIFVHTIKHTTQLFLIATSTYIAIQYLPHDEETIAYVTRIYFVIGMLQVGVWTNFLLDHWIVTTVNRRVRSNRAAASSISLLKLFAKFLFFSVIFLFTLHNLDIKITTIIAGFGVGGIAVALGIQKVIGDLLSSLSIVLDKPFVVGDFIIMEQYLGEVEKIGLRTTHLRGLGGEQIVIPNSDILASRIRNMKRMHERRVVLLFSLDLRTPPEKLEEAVSLIKAIVLRRDQVRLDRCHLAAVTRTSYDIELVYFFLHDDYNLHMDAQEIILFEITRALRAAELSYAYPAQVLHHELPQNLSNSNYISRVDREKFV